MDGDYHFSRWNDATEALRKEQWDREFQTALRELKSHAPLILISPETAAALCEESPAERPSEKQDQNCADESKRWRIPDGGQYWPDGQDCPKSCSSS